MHLFSATATFLTLIFAILPTGELAALEVISRPPAPVLKKGERQLLVDGAMIRSKQGLVRVTHSAKKREKPVLEAEMPWEIRDKGGVIDKRVNIYGAVLRDPATGAFRMWYADPGHVLYATSSDGVHWERPVLKVAGDNNVTDLTLHSPSIIEDRFERNPERRYKAVGCASMGVDVERLRRLKSKFDLADWYRDKDHRLYYSAYSADGFRWKVEPEPILLGCDTITLSQDPKTGDYLAFHKRQGDPRVVGIRQVFLSVSKDMEHWSEPQPVNVADELDNRETRKLKGGLYSEFYNMSAFPYEGQWLGFVTHFRRVDPPSALFGNDAVDGRKRSATGIIDVQLVHSRDGRRWVRCSDRTPVIPLGPYKYDAGSIFGLCNAPVIVGDEMWMYYTASTTPHGGLAPEKEQSIALAVWRIDGLASLRADGDVGTIETHEFIPEGKNLSVNAGFGSGRLLVEVLDSTGAVIPGYEKEASVIENQDAVKLPIRWKQTESLPHGIPIRLRFHLVSGDLYSYRIE